MLINFGFDTGTAAFIGVILLALVVIVLLIEMISISRAMTRMHGRIEDLHEELADRAAAPPAQNENWRSRTL